MIRKDSVILVTGANKGMGLAIAREALRMGYNVAAAARRPAEADGALGKCARLQCVKFDLAAPDTHRAAVEAAIGRFGRIDVLINNAGYGQGGYFEELSDALVRRQMEANFFGTIGLTREVLPHMRRARSGFIVTTTSTSGIRGVEGNSVYAASKFALEGWMEGLRPEVAPYGIRLMLLEPGAFRTNFFKDGSYGSSDMEIGDYDGRREAFRKRCAEWDGVQEGDPEKLAKNLFLALNSDEPPFRLLLGKSAFGAIDAYYKKRYEEFLKWKDVTEDTAF